MQAEVTALILEATEAPTDKRQVPIYLLSPMGNFKSVFNWKRWLQLKLF